MNRVPAGEVRLAYEQAGDGPPLLLLPGLGMRVEQWAPHLPILAIDHRVIALDLRGGAGSDVPAGPYTIETMAEDTAAAIVALGLERVDVLGMSMGGFVAQELTLAHPSLVRRQILALTARQPSARGRERLRVELALRERPELLELRFRSLFLWLFDDATYERKDAVDRLVGAAMAAAKEESPEGSRGQIAACLDYAGSSRLDTVSAPTLVIGAKDDLIYPPRETRALADGIPGARYLLLDAAHVLTGPAIRRFDEAVVAFLRED
ncbi:MAG: alpha/beta fold hydrolase [Polyangiaceae bacterium]|nr:alpha/beta fold hydrolase [Polyangiaceae bacterium]